MAILILVSIILQSTVCQMISIASIKPNLLIILTVSFGLMRGQKIRHADRILLRTADGYFLSTALLVSMQLIYLVGWDISADIFTAFFMTMTSRPHCF